MTRAEAERLLTENLRQAGIQEPALEARLFLRTIPISDTLNPEQTGRLEEFYKRRALGEPAAYILREKGFFKNDFIVEPGVLVPRPETEHLVEEALRIFQDNQPSEIADLGCGSGIIGLSLLQEWPKTRLTGFDISKVAIRISEANANKLGLSDRAEFFLKDVLQVNLDRKLDLVVANPPYIAIGDPQVEANVHKFEPHEALYAGPQGTECVQEWGSWAIENLQTGGWFVFEFGAGQQAAVAAIIERLGFQNIHFVNDYSGHPRICSAQRK